MASILYYMGGDREDKKMPQSVLKRTFMRPSKVSVTRFEFAFEFGICACVLFLEFAFEF